MEFNFPSKNLAKETNRESFRKVLIVRLPCNPIFPIGPIYLADHIHKCFPEIDQQFIDLAIVPLNNVSKYLKRKIDQFRPHIIVYSWRDIQIYAPVDGRSGNPLQNSFEVFYSNNILKKIRGAWGGLKLITSHYEEINRNTSLVKMGLNRAQKYNKSVKVILGGGAVSVFYEQLGKLLPKGTIISVGEGENLIEKVLKGDSIIEERCYLAGQKPRNKLIHEQPSGTIKTACNYKYIKSIWAEFDWYIEGGDYYVGVQTKRGCPHNCCFCVYGVVEGKKVRVNPVNEIIEEMKQLYEMGVRGFWFTDAQFIPTKNHIQDAKLLLQAIKDQGWTDLKWAAYIRADNIDRELAQLMVETGMSYFEIGITSGSQELVRKMQLAYNLKTVLENCRMLVEAGFRNHVSVNYSFNVFDETPNTIKQTVAYHRELENIFGKGLVDPAIFFIGLQPHTLLEKYALENNILKPSYNPMSMMPWTARKLLWNPGPLGKKLGEVCLEAFDNKDDEFGKTVINILERNYGKSSLDDSLKVRKLSERKLTAAKV
ncbi:photosystem II high light acclimation radical SAM protein [uncultured Prochlorococcus sp.]|uniref:photosystem II high light acclimation radical SAM protein n=1 Tax=uncultured Prochlorococcus sp. TaxID=159733 RepID=UPI000DFA98D9|nr:photosystem II high light acclimation radical SAM protein [uncultured Prochlorococcus sp.]RCL50892.1 MAG: radical SAM protein [Prochlorococcus sp. MED-G72]